MTAKNSNESTSADYDFSSDFAPLFKEEKRAERRRLVRWPVVLMRMDSVDRVLVQGNTAEISGMGARVLLDCTLGLGDELACRISARSPIFASPTIAIDVTSQVTHCAFSSRAGAFEVGLKFEAFHNGGQGRLADILLSFDRAMPVHGSNIVRSSRR